MDDEFDVKYHAPTPDEPSNPSVGELIDSFIRKITLTAELISLVAEVTAKINRIEEIQKELES